MKILHTSDWHIGKRLMGRERLSEQAAALDEIVGICEAEAVKESPAAPPKPRSGRKTGSGRGTKKALPKESRKVRGMIEVTDKESGRKIMVNISYLEVIFDEGMTASLCLMMRSPSRKATHYTIETEETYWEVKELIAQALA